MDSDFMIGHFHANRQWWIGSSHIWSERRLYLRLFFLLDGLYLASGTIRSWKSLISYSFPLNMIGTNSNFCLHFGPRRSHWNSTAVPNTTWLHNRYSENSYLINQIPQQWERLCASHSSQACLTNHCHQFCNYFDFYNYSTLKHYCSKAINWRLKHQN